MKKDIKDYCCDLTDGVTLEEAQQRANEAKELLLKYGEKAVYEAVSESSKYLKYHMNLGYWWLSPHFGKPFMKGNSLCFSEESDKTQVTYPEWKSILIEQYEPKNKVDENTPIGTKVVPHDKTAGVFSFNECKPQWEQQGFLYIIQHNDGGCACSDDKDSNRMCFNYSDLTLYEEPKEQKPKIRKSELLEEINQLKERQTELEKKVDELSKVKVTHIECFSPSSNQKFEVVTNIPSKQPRVVGGWYFFTDAIEKVKDRGIHYSRLYEINEHLENKYKSARFYWKYCLTYEEVQKLINNK